MRIMGGFRVIGGESGLKPVEEDMSSPFYGKTLGQALKNRRIPDMEWRRHVEDIRERRPYRGFVYSLGVGDKIFWGEVNGNPYFDDAGKFAGYRGTTRDITERKKTKR